jgi:hypothetical protein
MAEPPAPAPQHIKWPVTRRNLLVATKINIMQKLPVKLLITDAKGNPAAVDGAPTWTVDNNLITLTPSADGMSCDCAAAGGIGTSTVTATVDADLGAGVTPILGTLDIEIDAGPATVVQLQPGAPVDQ